MTEVGILFFFNVRIRINVNVIFSKQSIKQKCHFYPWKVWAALRKWVYRNKRWRWAHLSNCPVWDIFWFFFLPICILSVLFMFMFFLFLWNLISMKTEFASSSISCPAPQTCIHSKPHLILNEYLKNKSETILQPWLLCQ